jgi:hypothetical protein
MPILKEILINLYLQKKVRINLRSIEKKIEVTALGLFQIQSMYFRITIIQFMIDYSRTLKNTELRLNRKEKKKKIKNIKYR